MTELLPVAADQRSVPEFAALRGAIAEILEQGRTVNIVYAPTTVTHQAASEELALFRTAYPVPVSHEWTQAHPGIDVDLTGHGGGFVLPVNVAPLPQVPESRSWAPLVLLVSGWSGLGALFVTVLTGSPFAIVYVFVALVVSAFAFAAVYRDDRRPR